MIDRQLMLGVLASGGAAIFPTARAPAQAFPSRQVRMITPFPPGAGPDAALRLLADRLSKKWGQPVVVDNKPGGNGFIAVAAFKQGNANGYDLGRQQLQDG